jgi:hypothetical protein
MKITDKEYKIITEELSNRVKDIVFMNSLSGIKEKLPKREIEKILRIRPKENELEITYSVIILVNDLIQMLGRTKRSKN